MPNVDEWQRHFGGFLQENTKTKNSGFTNGQVQFGQGMGWLGSPMFGVVRIKEYIPHNSKGSVSDGSVRLDILGRDNWLVIGDGSCCRQDGMLWSCRRSMKGHHVAAVSMAYQRHNPYKTQWTGPFGFSRLSNPAEATLKLALCRPSLQILAKMHTSDSSHGELEGCATTQPNFLIFLYLDAYKFR